MAWCAPCVRPIRCNPMICIPVCSATSPMPDVHSLPILICTSLLCAALSGPCSLTCQVARYNLSGHADGEQIVHAVTKVAPKRLILVHGDALALEALAQRFPKIQVDIPVVGTTISLQAHARSKTTTQTQQRSRETRPPAPTGVTPAVSIDETPPTIEDLWKVACEKGPTRPWTSVELGQHYYGRAYHPGLRPQVEQVLKRAAAYFKQGRVGAQPTYL